jgi:signal transduction histidine kinase
MSDQGKGQENQQYITSQERLTRRLRYEEAISECSRILLADPPDAVDLALERLLQASEVPRVYIFENFIDDVDGLCMRQTHEVCAGGTESEIDNPILQHVVYAEGFDRWERRLAKGEHLSGLVEEFPESERAVLEPQSIVSILVLPIRTVKEWIGFVGFDDTKRKRRWSPEDIRLLRTAAELIGSYYSRKEYERLLAEGRERLAGANATKDRLFSIIAHDLRGPMASLKHGLVLLTDPNDDLSKDEEAEILNSFSEHLDATLELLDNLLHWSQQQQGLVEFRPQSITLHEVVEEVMRLHVPWARKKGIELQSEVDPAVTAYADRNAITLVLRNLIGNALKFTDAGGAVRVSARTDDDMVEVIVRDTGIGIDPETLEKLFHDEHVVTTRGTASERGTGIGLLLCRDFVYGNGGRITVTSTVGEGSSFSFTLPVSSPG